MTDDFVGNHGASMITLSTLASNLLMKSMVETPNCRPHVQTDRKIVMSRAFCCYLMAVNFVLLTNTYLYVLSLTISFMFVRAASFKSRRFLVVKSAGYKWWGGGFLFTVNVM